MKSLDFVFVGTPKNASCKVLEEHYLERVSYYCQSAKQIFVKDGKSSDLPLRIKQESDAILATLSSKDRLVICDERGQSLTSLQLSQRLEKWCSSTPRLVFVVGGAFGFDDAVRKRANDVIRLSDLTLPHELARILLLEQVYRSFSILRGERYHH